MSSSSPRAVSMMIGTLLWLRSRLQTSSPSRRGSMTSSTTRSTGLLAEPAERLLAVAGLDDRVAVPLERIREQGLDRFLVVDEENCRRVGHRSVRAGPRLAGAPTIARRWKRLGPGRAVAGCVAALLNALLTHGSCAWASSSSCPRFSRSCSPSRQRERFRGRRSTRSSTRSPRRRSREHALDRVPVPRSRAPRVPPEQRAGIARPSPRSASRPRRTSGRGPRGPRLGRASQHRHHRARVARRRRSSLVAHRDNAGSRRAARRQRVRNRGAHRARARIRAAGDRARPPAAAHARARVDRRRRVRWRRREPLRATVAARATAPSPSSCSTVSGPRPTTAGDRRGRARVSGSRARSDSGRAHRRGDRRRARRCPPSRRSSSTSAFRSHSASRVDSSRMDVAAVTLTTSEPGDHAASVGDPTRNRERLGQLGRATEALVSSLDASVGRRISHARQPLLRRPRCERLDGAARRSSSASFRSHSASSICSFAPSARGSRSHPRCARCGTRLGVRALRRPARLARRARPASSRRARRSRSRRTTSLLDEPADRRRSLFCWSRFVLGWLVGAAASCRVEAGAPDERLAGFAVALALARARRDRRLRSRSRTPSSSCCRRSTRGSGSRSTPALAARILLFAVGLARAGRRLVLLASELGLSVPEAALYVLGLFDRRLPVARRRRSSGSSGQQPPPRSARSRSDATHRTPAGWSRLPPGRIRRVARAGALVEREEADATRRLRARRRPAERGRARPLPPRGRSCATPGRRSARARIASPSRCRRRARTNSSRCGFRRNGAPSTPVRVARLRVRAPCRARSAGRTKTSAPTSDDTGFPGSPKTSVSPAHAERERLPGLDRDAPEDLLDAELGSDTSNEVVRTHRDAARGDEHVRLEARRDRLPMSVRRRPRRRAGPRRRRLRVASAAAIIARFDS